VTVIAVAPSTTWSLVIITPSERTTNPVPTPVLVPEPEKGSNVRTFVVTLTTAGDAAFTVRTTGSELATYVEFESGCAVAEPVDGDEVTAGARSDSAVSAEAHPVIRTSPRTRTLDLIRLALPLEPGLPMAHLLHRRRGRAALMRPVKTHRL
jgi:hypothetical protein